MTELEQKIKKLADNILETKTKQKRAKKFIFLSQKNDENLF